MKYPSKLQKYIVAAQQGTFVPDRENDELTEAPGNPEHPGQTRGMPGSIAWKVGLPAQAVTKPKREGGEWSRANCRS